MKPVEIVSKFNEFINNRDIQGLERLMTEDHTFIDSANNTDKGKKACLNAWRGFFQSFPDYKNIFENITAEKNVVKIIGYSTCSNPVLEGSAIWTAKIKEDKVSEWRVYEDNSDNRKLLNIKKN